MPLREILIYFGCLVVAVILHEVSHGVVAYLFGDDTAKRAGRLTLNPISHVDPFGSLILPAMGAIAGLPVIGWAKPVPVNVARLRNPRRDIVFVSLAGPFTNFALMALAAITTRALLRNAGVLSTTIDRGGTDLLVNVLFAFALVNLLLGLFNLLPIPPLDGSALLERLLPSRHLPTYYRLRSYGLLIIFLIVFTIPGFTESIIRPFFDALYDFVVS